MLAGVTLKANGVSYSLKFTTRAMMALEEANGGDLMGYIERVQKSPTIASVVSVLQETLNDGKGEADLEKVQDFVDTVGFVDAAAAMQKAIEAAFPEAVEGAKGQPRKKRRAAAK